MEDNKTKEEITPVIKFLIGKPTYSRKNHGINAHLKPRVYFYKSEDVEKWLEQYAEQSNRQKEDRIKSLEQGIERIMNQEICGDGWFHAQQVINICNELLNK